MNNKIYNHTEILEMVSPIFERHGITQASLFGSYARNEATEKSDIDFVVNYAKTPTLFTFCGLIEDLEVAFKKECHVITMSSLKKDESRISRDIKRNMVRFYN